MDLRQRCNEMAAEYDKSMTELLNDKVSFINAASTGIYHCEQGFTFG